MTPPWIRPQPVTRGPVLGIETSCDDTAAAVVHNRRVLGAAVASQVPIHRRFGGVVPEVAARNHLLTVLPTIQAALDQAGLTGAQLGGIAVTNRPGLIGALLVGVQTAKALAHAWHKPIVGVDHIAAHVWAVQLQPPDNVLGSWNAPNLPFAALAVSGGHTSLYAVHAHDDFRLLGRTLDDAAGEAFDKFAKQVGLPYPGGPEVDRLAQHGDPTRFKLPRGMLGRGDGAYSFSGLKTAIRLQIEQMPPEAVAAALPDLCASFQHAVVEQLVRVTLETVKRHGLRQLVVAGGVAANSGLRRALQAGCAKRRIWFWPVPVAYCGDNAVMVAGLGEALFWHGHHDDVFALDALATGDVKRAAQQSAK